MCYYITVALPKVTANSILTSLPKSLNSRPANNPDINKLLSKDYDLFAIITAMCSCDLYSPAKPSEKDKEEALRRKYKKKRWSENKIQRAIADHDRSHWECAWTFPKTGTAISIGLPGGESGPMPEARQFYLTLPARFDQILVASRPKLEDVFKTWLKQDLPQDIFTVVKLAGFGLEDARAQPVQWDISFETTGAKWLGIIIPFIGDTAQDAVVDT